MTRLYLGAVHFDGDPDALLPGYRRLLEDFPLETLDLPEPRVEPLGHVHVAHLLKEIG
jgi:hypothetical protein